MLVGLNEGDNDFGTVGKTGGAKTVTLTVDQIPRHNHSQNVLADGGSMPSRKDYGGDGNARSLPQGINTGDTGGSQAHNNLQPYISVYFWHRTA